MINLKSILVLIILISTNGKAQNYIPNYSFEDTLTSGNPYYTLKNWDNINLQTWNYFNLNHSQNYSDLSVPINFVGFQQPYSGAAYVGMNLDDYYSSPRRLVREYLHVKLNTVLIADTTYCLQMHLSLSDSSRIAAKGVLGVYFSNTKPLPAFPGNANLPHTPQVIVSPNNYVSDKNNWVPVSYTHLTLPTIYSV